MADNVSSIFREIRTIVHCEVEKEFLAYLDHITKPRLGKKEKVVLKKKNVKKGQHVKN